MPPRASAGHQRAQRAFLTTTELRTAMAVASAVASRPAPGDDRVDAVGDTALDLAARSFNGFG